MPDIDVTIGGSDWVLTFEDDFNGAANDPPDPSKWLNPWEANQFPGQQDAYLRAQNAYLDGNSNLIIEAKQESFGGASYTSGQIATIDLFEQAGGKFEASIQSPAGGGGIWPAGLWMDGHNWPTTGEIDIHEMWTNPLDTAQLSFHWNAGGHQSSTTSYQNSVLTTGFHTYGVEWDPGEEIRWYVDGVLRKTLTGSFITSAPMFMVIDFYLGGFTAPITASFPQYLKVGYVRAWQRA